jgi:hypothetical protein
MGELRNACYIVEKPERTRPLGRPRHEGKGSIRMDLRELGWEGMDWMHLAPDSD